MRSLVFVVVLAGSALSGAFGSSIDYVGSGSIGAGTAQLTGSATAASAITLASPLLAIGSGPVSGTMTITTGTLIATRNANVFDFTAGSITIMSGTETLFHGALSSGPITLLGQNFFRIAAAGDGIVFNLTDRHGDVATETMIAPEPGTFALLGTGLLGLVGFASKKRRPYFTACTNFAPS